MAGVVCPSGLQETVRDFNQRKAKACTGNLICAVSQTHELQGRRKDFHIKGFLPATNQTP
jgi:hypothetical protein